MEGQSGSKTGDDNEKEIEGLTSTTCNTDAAIDSRGKALFKILSEL